MGTNGVIIYDGDCGFCTSTVDWAKRHVLDPAVQTTPWQSADLASFGLTRADADDSVWWIAPDGVAYPGGEAVAAALSASGTPWSWAGQAMGLPGIAGVTRVAYRWVANNRHRFGFVADRLASRD